MTNDHRQLIITAGGNNQIAGRDVHIGWTHSGAESLEGRIGDLLAAIGKGAIRVPEGNEVTAHLEGARAALSIDDVPVATSFIERAASAAIPIAGLFAPVVEIMRSIQGMSS